MATTEMHGFKLKIRDLKMVKTGDGPWQIEKLGGVEVEVDGKPLANGSSTSTALAAGRRRPRSARAR